MLVYLGRNVSVHGEDIIALTDLQQENSPSTAALMERHQARGRLRTLGPEPKTLVLCRSRQKQDRETVCYLSCVGLRTLRLRVEGAQALAAGPETHRPDDDERGAT